jgi:transmembrane sensor
MSCTPHRLSLLFQRYYDQTATDEEVKELMEIINVSASDEALTSVVREMWEKLGKGENVLPVEVSDRIWNSIPLNPKDNTFDRNWQRLPSSSPAYWIRYSAAAVVVILLGMASWWGFREKDSSETSRSEVLVENVEPGANRASLTLGDGRVIDLGDVAIGTIALQGNRSVNKIADGRLVYDEKSNGGESNEVNVVTTPRGGQYQVLLPDGSQVWLNAASSITFPANFAGAERRVKITGEVFFDVASEMDRPFRVAFGDNEIEVLGTQFNVSHYGDGEVSLATLVEGAISLKRGKIRRSLFPGQAASVNTDGSLELSAVDVESVIAWKEGFFYFKDANVQTLMKQIARWYDLDVSYQGPIPEKLLNGKVARNRSLEELMDMLQYAGLNYRINGKELIISQ